jgi:hypothetical protein
MVMMQSVNAKDSIGDLYVDPVDVVVVCAAYFGAMKFRAAHEQIDDIIEISPPTGLLDVLSQGLHDLECSRNS